MRLTKGTVIQKCKSGINEEMSIQIPNGRQYILSYSESWETKLQEIITLLNNDDYPEEFEKLNLICPKFDTRIGALTFKKFYEYFIPSTFEFYVIEKSLQPIDISIKIDTNWSNFDFSSSGAFYLFKGLNDYPGIEDTESYYGYSITNRICALHLLPCEHLIEDPKKQLFADSIIKINNITEKFDLSLFQIGYTKRGRSYFRAYCKINSFEFDFIYFFTFIDFSLEKISNMIRKKEDFNLHHISFITLEFKEEFQLEAVHLKTDLPSKDCCYFLKKHFDISDNSFRKFEEIEENLQLSGPTFVEYRMNLTGDVSVFFDYNFNITYVLYEDY